MGEKPWLFIVIGTVAVITVVLVFALAALWHTFLAASKLAVLLAFLLPGGIAARWLFHKLQARLTKRESRAVATSFGVLAPAWLGISMLLGEFSGGYADMLGSFWAFAGAFIGVASTATLVSFGLCLLTLSITRHIVKLEQAQD